MGNCKHFPDADDHCLVCEEAEKNKLELHVLTVNMPKDEVEFPLSAVRTFSDASTLKDFADVHYPGWTSLLIVALPPKPV